MFYSCQPNYAVVTYVIFEFFLFRIFESFHTIDPTVVKIRQCPSSPPATTSLWQRKVQSASRRGAMAKPVVSGKLKNYLNIKAGVACTNVCCYWNADSSRGRSFHLSESYLEQETRLFNCSSGLAGQYLILGDCSSE